MAEQQSFNGERWQRLQGPDGIADLRVSDTGEGSALSLIWETGRLMRAGEKARQTPKRRFRLKQDIVRKARMPRG